MSVVRDKSIVFPELHLQLLIIIPRSFGSDVKNSGFKYFIPFRTVIVMIVV